MHSCNCRLLAWQASCFLLAQPTGYVPLSCSLLFGCSLGKEGVDEASLLCTCVFGGELSLLRRLLRARLEAGVNHACCAAKFGCLLEVAGQHLKLVL